MENVNVIVCVGASFAFFSGWKRKLEFNISAIVAIWRVGVLLFVSSPLTGFFSLCRMMSIAVQTAQQLDLFRIISRMNAANQPTVRKTIPMNVFNLS